MERNNPIVKYFGYLALMFVATGSMSLWGVFVFGVVLLLINKYVIVDREPIRFVIAVLLIILFFLIVWVIQMIF